MVTMWTAAVVTGRGDTLQQHCEGVGDTWLEQCTAPYIEVMGEKSMTCSLVEKNMSQETC
jgi:hypothetical protein